MSDSSPLDEDMKDLVVLINQLSTENIDKLFKKNHLMVHEVHVLQPRSPSGLGTFGWESNVEK
jgi:hypothetical protein